MAACEPKIFPNVTPTVFESLKSRLAGVGYKLEATSGTVKGPMGIVIDYAWDESTSNLVIHVVEKNMLIPCSKIYSELEKALMAP